ncbi:MAG: YihY/virulence factor BrkB family protein [Acidimicrobiales bacterium]
MTRLPPESHTGRLAGVQKLADRIPARGRKGIDIARAVLRSSSRDRITTGAGSLSFHWFLAIFPAMIALTGLTGLAGLSSRDLRSLVHGIGVVLPSGVSQVLVEALHHSGNAQTSFLEVLIGAGVAIWSGIESMAALQVGLDQAFDVRTDRGFVGRRLMALPLLGATVALGVLAFALVVLGAPIGTLLRRDVPLAGGTFDVLFNVVRVAGALGAVMLLISILYWLGPNRPESRFQRVTPGSLVATLGWLAASILLSVYLNDFGHETTSYGAFADIAILLLWLFISATAVLLGGELDHELELRYGEGWPEWTVAGRSALVALLEWRPKRHPPRTNEVSDTPSGGRRVTHYIESDTLPVGA